MKKFILVIFLGIFFSFVSNNNSYAEEANTNEGYWVDAVVYRLFLDHLLLSANAEYTDKALEITSSTVANELSSEGLHSISLKYSISPLGIRNAFGQKNSKEDRQDTNDITSLGITDIRFWDNLNFYIQGNLGNKFVQTENGSGITLKTTDEASYKVGVQFTWCVGTGKSKCNAY